MFIKSAANDQLQSKAISAVNERWGESFRKWGGRETIGIPVCKKKYAPFSFSIEEEDVDEDKEQGEENNGPRRRPKLKVTVRRMFGCKCHSGLRKSVIEQHGVRPGWEPFGQWSMKKALDLARKETERLNQPRSDKTASGSDSSTDGTTSEDWTSSDEEKLYNNALPSMCNNGSCTWKVKAKYDDIYREIHGDSDDED
jgi:hypothetical protein